MIYYKALTTARKSWYDGKTLWRVGKPMPALNGAKGELCGVGYHLWKSLNDAMRHSKMPALVYEAEIDGDVLGEDNEEIRVTSARIVRNVTPEYIKRANAFIASIPKVKWMSACQPPREEWMLFDTRAASMAASMAASRAASWAASWDASRAASRNASRAASWAASRAASRAASWDASWAASRAASRAASWDASRAASWAASWDAELMTGMAICHGLHIDQKHRDHAAARWDVWQRGYGLLCDVGGVLYVYRRIV